MKNFFKIAKRLCRLACAWVPVDSLLGLLHGSPHRNRTFFYSIISILLFMVIVITIIISLFVLSSSPSEAVKPAYLYYFKYVESFLFMLIIPSIILIIFDLFFLMLILPFFKSATGPIMFDYEYITRSMIFDFSHTYQNKADGILLRPHVFPVAHYRFLLPKIFSDDEYNKKDIEQYLKKISNLIWAIWLMRKPLKEYAYLILNLLLFVVFFIAVYKFYYVEFLGHSHYIKGYSFPQMSIKSKYILVYLIIWILYVIFRLKTLTGTGFFIYGLQVESSASEDNAKFQLSRIRIKYWEKYSNDSPPILPSDYDVQSLKEDIFKLRENNKNIERVIEFATAIVAMLIAQFITAS